MEKKERGLGRVGLGNRRRGKEMKVVGERGEEWGERDTWGKKRMSWVLQFCLGFVKQRIQKYLLEGEICKISMKF